MRHWIRLLLFVLSASLVSAETPVEGYTFKELAAKANAGDADALMMIANCYLFGAGVKKDPAKAEQIYRILVERTRPIATPDKPTELRRMGSALRILSSLSKKHGDKVAAKSMLMEAFDWTQKAALCGDGVAQATLSEDYFRGDEVVPKNEVEAYAWEIVAARYHPNPNFKSELATAVVNDSYRVNPAVWAQVVKRSEELLAQIEAAKSARSTTN